MSSVRMRLLNVSAMYKAASSRDSAKPLGRLKLTEVPNPSTTSFSIPKTRPTPPATVVTWPVDTATFRMRLFTVSATYSVDPSRVTTKLVIPANSAAVPVPSALPSESLPTRNEADPESKSSEKILIPPT
eukprot:3941243-Rhodomonas_salina.2